LPRTSTSRNDKGFLRLLTAVDPHAPPGLQFRGQLLTPGASFDPASLPRPAVLLECAGSVRVEEGSGRYCFRHMWLLWRWNAERGEWIEVVRETSDSAEWTLNFVPIAVRLLRAEGDDLRRADLGRAETERIAELIGEALGQLSRELACFVLAGLDAFIGSEIVRRSKPLTIARPYGRLGRHEDAPPGKLRPGGW
jgi:hypothetical protein